MNSLLISGLMIIKAKTNIKRKEYVMYMDNKMPTTPTLLTSSNLDIVSLIESNPITKLSSMYNNKFLTKIKETFTETQQQLFVSSFYCYLNYHPTNDYVIDLDNVWKWLGFSQKIRARELLEKHFVLETDYKCLLSLEREQKHNNRGGHNKQTFLLNIQTFKRFCIKSDTKKANEIHEYFIKLEELMHTIVQEESNELKLQLENHVIQFETYKQNTNHEKELLREKTLLEQFSKNTQCIYYGYIDNKQDDDEYVIKFGHSNHLSNRIEQHKKTYKNFRLINAYRVENRTQIENEIKNHKELKDHRRTYTIDNINYTELLANIESTQLDKIIKEIIIQIEYSPENYAKLWEKSQKLTDENQQLHTRIQHVTKELHRVKHEFHIYIKQNKTTTKINDVRSVDASNESHHNISSPTEDPDAGNETSEHRKHIRRYQKHKDGHYYIDNNQYQLLSGTREQVWDNIAYRTEGGLIKSDFIMNSMNKIVSKSKSIHSKTNIRSICQKKQTEHRTNEI